MDVANQSMPQQWGLVRHGLQPRDDGIFFHHRDTESTEIFSRHSFVPISLCNLRTSVVNDSGDYFLLKISAAFPAVRR